MFYHPSCRSLTRVTSCDRHRLLSSHSNPALRIIFAYEGSDVPYSLEDPGCLIRVLEIIKPTCLVHTSYDDDVLAPVQGQLLRAECGGLLWFTLLPELRSLPDLLPKI
jgi:hypothetical protein